jgi:hypothetical protein
MNFDRHADQNNSNKVIISNNAYDNYVIKPIMGGLAQVSNWFFTTLKPVVNWF